MSLFETNLLAEIFAAGVGLPYIAVWSAVSARS